MKPNTKDMEVLKARLFINRINSRTSLESDEVLKEIIESIEAVITDVELIKQSCAMVARGDLLKGAHYELSSSLQKSKVMNKELDLKIFRTAIKVWLCYEFRANFAIADFFATWLQRELPKERFRDICDAIYAEI